MCIEGYFTVAPWNLAVVSNTRYSGLYITYKINTDACWGPYAIFELIPPVGKVRKLLDMCRRG